MSRWKGWWEQAAYGRQEMRNLVLEIAPSGEAAGSGEDCIGRFTFSGTVAPEVVLVKQYIGQHSILYLGTNSGEGIFGMWRHPGLDPLEGFDTGRFALFPARDASKKCVEAQELTPNRRE